MNLSRSVHDLVKIFLSFEQACVYFKPTNFRKVKTCVFRNLHSSSPRLAAVDQNVLVRVENEWKETLGKVEHYRNAIFVLGPMGAGKTTVIENRFKTHPLFRHYAYVDTDEIMGSIDAFTADKVDQYYPLARKIAIRLTDWILTKKFSFVAEGTCVKVDELIEYMERLKKSGYKIHVNCLPAVPLDVILCRSKHRKNRIIPDDVVESIYKNANRGLKQLYDYKKSVDYALFEDLDLGQNSEKKRHADVNHAKPLYAR